MKTQPQDGSIWRQIDTLPASSDLFMRWVWLYCWLSTEKIIYQGSFHRFLSQTSLSPAVVNFSMLLGFYVFLSATLRPPSLLFLCFPSSSSHSTPSANKIFMTGSLSNWLFYMPSVEETDLSPGMCWVSKRTAHTSTTEMNTY